MWSNRVNLLGTRTLVVKSPIRYSGEGEIKLMLLALVIAKTRARARSNTSMEIMMTNHPLLIKRVTSPLTATSSSDITSPY